MRNKIYFRPIEGFVYVPDVTNAPISPSSVSDTIDELPKKKLVFPPDSLFASSNEVGSNEGEKSYRVSLQCPPSESSLKYSYESSRAQITISVGCSKKHTGAYFRDTLEKVVTTFGGKVTIMLDDSVQWRTLRIDHPELSDEELKDLAIKNGDKWLADHQQYLDQYPNNEYPNIKVIRWKDLENDEKYPSAVAKMKGLYETTNYNDTGKPHPIKTAIDNTAQHFLNRVKERKNYEIIAQNHTDNQILDMSRKYLIEECAVMAELWPDLKTHFELYVSQRTEAMVATYEHLIKDVHPGQLRALTLDFHLKNKKRTCSNISDTSDPPDTNQTRTATLQ